VECGIIHEPGAEQDPEIIEPVDVRVDGLLEEGRKVEAVKAVLDAEGAGLKAVMDRVKAREREQPGVGPLCRRQHITIRLRLGPPHGGLRPNRP
jgi:hypothetical protein